MNTSELDLNDIGGPSISNLKNKKEEIEIDYSKILDELDINNINNNISYETKENQIKNIQNTNESKKSKKNINMNSFVRNLETNIENLSKNISNIPHETIKIITKTNEKTDKSIYEQIIEFKYIDIIFCILLFMLLNNKLTIETIYKLPYINIENGVFLNLLIRSIMFGLILFIIKKY